MMWYTTTMRDRTPKYVVQFWHVGISTSIAAWRGQATVKRLLNYMEGYNKSTLPGGANARVGEVFGVSKARAYKAVIYTNDSERRNVAEVYDATVPTCTACGSKAHVARECPSDLFDQE